MKAEDDVEAAARAGRRALSHLPGFASGDALASAVLTALVPGRMAIYDARAHTGLTRLGLHLDARPGRYGSYMRLIEHLQLSLASSGLHWSPRDVDLALFMLGSRRQADPATNPEEKAWR